MFDAIMIGVTVYMLRLLARPFAHPPAPLRVLPAAWLKLNRVAATELEAASSERYHFFAAALIYPAFIFCPRRLHGSAERFGVGGAAIDLLIFIARVSSIDFVTARFRGIQRKGIHPAARAIDLMPFLKFATSSWRHCYEHTLPHGFQPIFNLR